MIVSDKVEERRRLGNVINHGHRREVKITTREANEHGNGYVRDPRSCKISVYHMGGGCFVLPDSQSEGRSRDEDGGW